MTKAPGKCTASDGFTLIEIVITIVIGAVLGALIVPFLSKALTASSEPIQRLSSAMDLKLVVENIIEKYEQNPTDLASLKSAIGDEDTTQSNSYGSYEVVSNRYIKFSSYNDTSITGGDPENLLKVTVKSTDTGETVTTLFYQES